MALGLAAGASAPTCVGLIADHVSAADRGVAMGLFEAACGVSILASGLLGGFAAEAFGGEAPYLIVGALALAWAGVLARALRPVRALTAPRAATPTRAGRIGSDVTASPPPDTRRGRRPRDACRHARVLRGRRLARALLHETGDHAHVAEALGTSGNAAGDRRAGSRARSGSRAGHWPSGSRIGRGRWSS